MGKLDGEIRNFLRDRKTEQTDARQRAALQLLCGIDLSVILGAEEAARAKGLRHVERMMTRERLRGLARHWSYDLNRHIALKQAADRLRATLPIDQTQLSAQSRTGRKTAPEGAARRGFEIFREARRRASSCRG